MLKYLKTLLSEKNIDLDLVLEVEGASGTNFMPLSMVVDAIGNAPSHEQAGIRKMLVMIDFKNGDVLHYIRHLAQALAI